MTETQRAAVLIVSTKRVAQDSKFIVSDRGQKRRVKDKAHRLFPTVTQKFDVEFEQMDHVSRVSIGNASRDYLAVEAVHEASFASRIERRNVSHLIELGALRVTAVQRHIRIGFGAA